MTRLGILASHRGSNFQAIIDACERGQINAKPVLAISNNSQSMALTRARQAGIKALHISGVTHPDDHDQAIADALTEQGIDLVITAGYMKKLGPVTLARFTGKIINVHPSLLPRHGGPGMYGLKVHQAVIDAGDHETGISIHRVESDYDSGPVIAQVRIPVASDDTAVSLAQKVIQREHALLVSTLASLVSLNTTETCR
jgi:phosphoribosylglycinamide formyltransferase-1